MKPLYALLSLIGLTYLPAHATVYTIDYTAKVNSVKVSPDTWSSGAEAGATTLPGALIAVGDTLHGKSFMTPTCPAMA